ncbi:unnamed protein product [Clonostachys rosea]|uniref:Zn(2)-C6 fungal-type domain-containing protein n=1 Tax=Bionectria ochroleuca TaxID=29856 RepID=A0ABY6UHW1_BIOOC|nr:unnamed protein product [Clonostachys rosea]
MSLTARERHNPPPRQKSCAACIKSKRRCDAVFPTCQRCAQRGIECEYLARKRRKAPASAAPIPTPPSSTGLADLHYLSGGIPSPPVAAESLCAGFASGESLFPSTIDPLMPMVDTPDFDQDPSFLSMNFPFDTMEDTNLGLVHQPAILAAPVHRDIDPIVLFQDKLQYALDEIKKMPASMVREMKTPWCHFRLYKSGMPRPMQDAVACCALYLAKNKINGPFIMRSIEVKVNELIATPEPSDTLGLLARTQALLLYHIIRVFDGDIAARAAAERTQSALEDCAMSLIPLVSFDCDPQKPAGVNLSLEPIGQVNKFWQDWVFDESARRTLLFTFFFLQIYRVLSGPVTECDGRLGLCHTFTLSSYLWHADGPLTFARAWKERRHLVISNADFQAVFREARADEIDEFGRLLLTTILGKEDTESFLASRGGSLQIPAMIAA